MTVPCNPATRPQIAVREQTLERDRESRMMYRLPHNCLLLAVCSTSSVEVTFMLMMSSHGHSIFSTPDPIRHGR